MKYPLKNLAVLLFSSLFLLTMISTVCAQTDNAAEPATIAEGSKVSLEYSLSLEGEDVVDTNVGGEPLVFVYGSKQIIPGLETQLTGMTKGDTKKIEVAPEEGYGPIYEEAVVTANVNQFPEELRQVGAMVQTQGQDGRTFQGKVVSIEGEEVTVDFNHPLAGKTLFFDVKVLSVE